MKNLWKAVAGLVVAAGVGMAQEAITVKVEGGGSCNTRAAGLNTFPVTAWSFGASQQQTFGTSGGAAGKVQMSNLIVNKLMDECSTLLFKMVSMGTHVDKITLTQTDATGRTTLMTVELQTATVMGYQLSGATNAGPGETVNFGFGKIVITYYGGSGKTTFGWDMTANKMFIP